ncbi:PaaI family thioesterase [Paraburkholderia sp. C35]|uniref:PaaI family thioesterase n=1 Tax=Paraburkholderia sp. C35 TaxID=2126993 RepID=UPI000D686BE4|nr:PaaI family thioesterase [Paraburkholderia sp. C35]
MNTNEQNTRKLTGLEQLHLFIRAGGRAPIGETLDFALVEAREGFVAFESVPTSRLYNPIGTVHGGYIATLLDSACGCAAHSLLSDSQGYTTLDLKVAYHKAITGTTGKVRSEGKVVSIGKRVAFAEATLRDESGKLYASASSTLLVFEK